MKYLITLAVLLSSLTFMACEGDPGPPGQPGADGLDGADGMIGFVMQWPGVDFSVSNEFSAVLPFSDFDFEALESEVALAYLLWDIDVETGERIWRQLPQTLIIPEGLLQYNYDFTRFDVKIFMDGDFELATLGANDTDDWTVRVVVVPADFVGGRKAATEMSYEELAEKLGLPELIDQPYEYLSRRDLPDAN